MARHRVPMWQQPQKTVVVEDDSTSGAVVGYNLRWPNGAVVTEAELRGGASSGGTAGGGSSPSGTGVSSWSLLLNIPANVSALAGLNGAGFPTRDGAGDWYQRSIVGTAGRVAVTFGDGAMGNPAIDLATLTNAGGGSLVKLSRDAYGRVAGTSAADTGDLAEGSNLYFTNPRAVAAVTATLAGLPNAVDDAAAAGAGVPVGGRYRNGSVLMVRIA